MNISLLWFDDRKNLSLKDKIVEAALYFRRKYGKAPTLCLVNPKDIAGTDLSEVQCPEQISVTVRPWNPVIQSHFYIGVDETPDYVNKPGGPAGERKDES